MPASPRPGLLRASAPWPRRSIARYSRSAACVLALGAFIYLMQALTLPSSVRLASPDTSPCTRAPDADRLLHLIAHECARRQPTYISLAPDRTIHTSPDAAGCRPLEIMLAPAERGFGMCTDVAFYVLHLGARIVPFTVAMFPEYNNTCQHPKTRARMHLETIYTESLQGAPGVTNVMLVNSEHLFTFDSHKHVFMHLYICKTRFCVEPMLAYIKHRGIDAEVTYVGHSSLDPTVSFPKPPSSSRRIRSGSAGSSNADSAGSGNTGAARRRRLVEVPAADAAGRQQEPATGPAGGQRPAAGGALGPAPVAEPAADQAPKPGPGGLVKDYQQALHVRGKSGLKHTQQILECWREEPLFPPLTVVAFDYKLGSLVEFHDIQNIKFRPPMPGNDTLAARVRAARDKLHRVQAEPWLLDRATFAREYPEWKKRRAGAAAAHTEAGATPAPTTHHRSARKLHAAPPAYGLFGRWFRSKAGGPAAVPRRKKRELSAEGDAFTEEEYRAAAAEFRKQHDLAVEAAARNVDAVINAGPSVVGGIGAEEIQRLQLESGIHICVSEREGFGHYLNEARAAGALIVTTDHPPMNELVRPGMGILVKPHMTNSHTDLQSLGNFTHLNAYCPPDVICQAVETALSLSDSERRAMGQRAREAFLQERCEFEQRLKVLEKELLVNA